MAKKISINSLKPISEVVRVYSGKPGCACGCRGKYYPKKRDAQPTAKDCMMITRVYRLFEENLNHVTSWEGSEDELIVLDISDNRTYTIYY
jgi:hypothetical protein